MKPLTDALLHPEKVFIPYIIIEWGYNDKWKQISTVDDCPPEMLRNVTSTLVAAGYHPFAEDEGKGEGRRSWMLLDPDESEKWTVPNVIWKHKASSITTQPLVHRF